MKKIFNILTAALLALSFISGCTPKEQKLYILSLNDQHGNIIDLDGALRANTKIYVKL